MNLQLDHLRALVASVDAGSLDAAAARLSITPSAVSQRIKALETSVGRVLLRRSKPVAPTESGRVLLRLGRHVDLLCADAAAELGDDAATTLPIAVNADSLDTWVLPAFASVDGVRFTIHREDEAHTAGLLRDGVVVAAITATADAVQGCSVTPLGAMRYRPMAEPGFARRWFAGVDLADALAVAPVVAFDRKDDLQDRYLRSRSSGRADPPRHLVPASAGFAEAVRLGLGWGMLPAPHSDGPGLVEIEPGAHVDVPLHWQQWKLPSAALAAVASAVHETARRRLSAISPSDRPAAGP